jgi:hypothetical protein
MGAKKKAKRRPARKSVVEVPLLELQQRLRQHMRAREEWAAMIKQCYDLMMAGDKAEARKLLPEIERLAKLITELEGKS